MRLHFFWLIIVLFISFSVQAQKKVPLNDDVYDSWNNIENPGLSHHGKLLHFELNPQYGDGILIIRNSITGITDTLSRGYQARVAPDESFVAYKIKAPLQTIRKAKLDGKKKDELPMDSLGILLTDGRKLTFPFLESLQVADEMGKVVLGLFKPADVMSDTSLMDSTALKPLKPVRKKDSEKEFTLRLIFPEKDTSLVRENVTQAQMSENGNTVAYVQLEGDSTKTQNVYIHDVASGTEQNIYQAGSIKNLNIYRNGERLAFLASSDTTKEKRYSLFLCEQGKCTMICDTSDAKIQKIYSPSENGKVYFSYDGSKLYFGIAETPQTEPKDTLTDDEKAKVDVWSYNDPKLQSQQLKELESDKKKTFLSVYNLKEKKITLLGNDSIDYVDAGFRGDGTMALGYANSPYQLQSSWTGRRLRDIYLIDKLSGNRKLLLKAHEGPVSLSNNGKYLAWYALSDSLWHTMTIKDGKQTTHKVKNINFYDELNDVPGLPGPEGYAGWTKDERYFIVYDRFDLWSLSPDGKQEPVNITLGNGREKKIKFRNLRINNEVPYIGLESGELLLRSFNEKTKESGYYLANKITAPQLLIEADAKFSSPVKARDTSIVVWSKSDFTQYPDLWLSDLTFRNAKKISHANPQQGRYLWGSVSIYQWISTGGDTLDGLLYTPENFDKDEKYPLLIYFYEKYSNDIHQHYIPKPSRSIISPTYCTSNGYVVLIPDISYINGYPGQSAYNAVVSGALSLISDGFIDKERIGIQGQSWGGYQVAWLVTRTNLFRAAMAGAPVSNMTSAYGGIRWESGMVRQFQYESGQSRIGATLWERPDLYIENSPLFRADQVETPLLIMANDGDGAVPWYQGIELFTALRRLQKPVWMLNYNGDEHNLKQRANMKDLDRRMMQFFDHYLKEAPAPEWMKTGVPALKKGKL
ncbi:MAG: prolyl oligopeptidase family serine peptidase [Lentimicrobiaceae bacterium]|nr:prolyl oligopeptidase family serine peptidase [Lentimicrobiaceae bacterium]